MGKRRGGQHRKAKNIAESHTGHEECPGDVTAPQSTDTSISAPGGFVFSDYLRGVLPVLDDLVRRIHAEVDPGISNAERNALLKQILEKLAGKELSAMRHQRGGKIVERLFVILKKIAQDATPDVKADTLGDDVFSIKDAHRTVKHYLHLLAGDAASNATHMYASHCIQSLLALVPLYMSLGLDGETETKGMSLSETFLYFFNALSLRSLIFDPAASHVIRSCLLILNGYTPTKAKEARAQRRATSELGAKVAVEDTFSTVFGELMHGLIEDIEQDPLRYGLHVTGNPVLQLVVHLLADQKTKHSELYHSFMELFLPKSSAQLEAKRSQLDQMLTSPVGSRLMETLMVFAAKEELHVFVWNYLKTADSVTALASHSYGNFVFQRLLQNTSLDEGHLGHLVSSLKYDDILHNHCEGVIWKLAEACLRLRSQYKELLHGYVAVINPTGNPKTLWWSIITSAPCTLQEFDQMQQTVDANMTSSNTTHNGEAALGERPANQLAEDLRKSKHVRSPTQLGCSILATFLKFPASVLTPLLNGFKAFSSSSNLPALTTLAKDRQGSWLIQTILVRDQQHRSHCVEQDPRTPIPPKQLTRFLRTLLPVIPDFALHPNASFVADLKKHMIESLVPHADTLKSANYALFRTLDLGVYLENHQHWDAAAGKKEKVQKLFRDILQDPLTPTEEKKTREKKRKKLNDVTAVGAKKVKQHAT